ncbi:RNA polymerase subunit sigma-24 [Ktedonobacter sp. SOSP1-85]|uniref:RNA polymerase sigma factor n=1 Tax=Ktedonobacter sp. SOSP1-85 TaxID=2778367 RepID=UPI0019152123|nr:RNA polymerase sigma factor [Ktedonobacter sp. SOSP1-85]GHO74062.1 RNA polymerase subunit sigma-24 [Ktedonobacter sp. SOSP1-85]
MIDETIILRAQKGDSRAFQQIVEKYHGLTWRTARVLLGNSTLVEDILQEAWIDVWRGLPRLQNRQTFRSWLLTVVANRCRMTFRRSVPMTVSMETEPDVLLLPSEIEDALEQIMRQEMSVDLQAALGMLPADQRRVLELRYFADLELSEIAEVTSLPLGTVKSRLHRATNALRTLLQVKKEKLFL